MAELLDELGYPREVTKTEVVAAYLQTIQRPLNCLSAEEQKSRRNAIEKLHVCLLVDDGAGSLPPIDVLQAAWDEVILAKVLRCVSDPTEKCRELAIQLIRGVAQALTEVDCTLTETVGVMAERMGQLPVQEDSEEIRLQLFSVLIVVLLPQCGLPTLQTIIEPLHLIVAATLHDHFHEVQKSVCSVLVTIANRDPDVFGNKTGTILKALVPCLSHSHSRVRIAVFQAIDAMVRCGLTATSVAQDLAPGTKSLAFDHATAVRELFFASVANWLNYNARTMSEDEVHECAVAGKIPRFHVPELLPLLLLGITDDSLDIATSTYEKLEDIGEIYKKVIDHLDREMNAGNSAAADIPSQENVSSERVADGNLEIGCEGTKLGESPHVQVLEDGNAVVVSSCANVGFPERREEEKERTARDASTAEAVHGTRLKIDYSNPSQAGSLTPRHRFHTSSVETADIVENRGSCGSNVEHEELPDPAARVDAELTRKDPGIPIEPVKSYEESKMAGEKMGVSGLHALAQAVHLENEIESVKRLSLIDAEKNITSEITDEGAVRKKDSDEAGIETLQLPKPYRGRPGAGCRLMTEAFLRPMIEPALKELKQWTIPTRLSAARLLHTLLVLAEGFAKDNLDILIPAFCSAVGDDDVKVAKRVVACIHIVGFHVPPDKWLPLVLKPLGNKKTSQAQSANVLVVTAAFLYGTPRKDIEEKHVENICDKLYERDVCCSDHVAVQNQLLSVVTNLIQVAGALCKPSSFKIFVLLLQLQSFEGDAQLRKRSGLVLEALAQAFGMESARELYVKHIHSMLNIVTAGHEGWSSGLPGKLMFQTFMRNAKDTVGPYLETLIPVFRVCLHSDQDPALRISFLQLLDELFEKPELESSWAPLAPDVIVHLLLPCGVWRASKTEAAIRYGAMVAIGTFLRRNLCSQAQMHKIMNMSDGLLPVVKTCIDEDYFLDVRRATTHVLYQFLRVYGSMLIDEQRTKLIKVLTKRLDDSSNTIRLAILPSVAMLFTTMPSSFSDSEVKEFISFLVAHMDDEHPHIQEGTCRAMEACALKKPHVVLDVLSSIRRQHKNPEYLDRVFSAAGCAKCKTASERNYT